MQLATGYTLGLSEEIFLSWSPKDNGYGGQILSDEAFGKDG